MIESPILGEKLHMTPVSNPKFNAEQLFTSYVFRKNQRFLSYGRFFENTPGQNFEWILATTPILSDYFRQLYKVKNRNLAEI